MGKTSEFNDKKHPGDVVVPTKPAQDLAVLVEQSKTVADLKPILLALLKKQ